MGMLSAGYLSIFKVLENSTTNDDKKENNNGWES